VGSSLWRIYETKTSLLFNLKQDIGEQNNLADSNPTKTAELEKRLSDHLAAVNAQVAIVNKNYDPSKPDAPARSKRDRKKNKGRKSK